jgi:hypothetical protein
VDAEVGGVLIALVNGQKTIPAKGNLLANFAVFIPRVAQCAIIAKENDMCDACDRARKKKLQIPVSLSSIETGENFSFNGERYVKIPEMNLKCGKEGFLINCLFLQSECDGFEPSTIIGEYILPETMVLPLGD